MRSSTSAAPDNHLPPPDARPHAGPRGGPATRERRAPTYAHATTPPRCFGRWRPATGWAPASGIAPVPLLTPWIAAIVIAQLLPEARCILVVELDAAHPLRALPEVEVWHEQACRPPVLRRQRLAVVTERDPCLSAGDVGKGKVGGVAAVAERDDERSASDARRRRGAKQRVDADAFPLRVELRPLRHTVDVHGGRFVREREKLLPRPPHFAPIRAANREVPRREIDARCRTSGQHGEV